MKHPLQITKVAANIFCKKKKKKERNEESNRNSWWKRSMKKWETVASVLKFHASLDADARGSFPTSHPPSPISRWFPFAGILGARFLGGNNGARALQEQSNLQRAAPGVIFRTSQSDMWPCSLGILVLLCSTLNCSCGTSCCTACNDVDVDVGGTFIIETLEPAGKKAKNPTQVPELRAH